VLSPLRAEEVRPSPSGPACGEEASLYAERDLLCRLGELVRDRGMVGGGIRGRPGVSAPAGDGESALR